MKIRKPSNHLLTSVFALSVQNLLLISVCWKIIFTMVACSVCLVTALLKTLMLVTKFSTCRRDSRRQPTVGNFHTTLQTVYYILKFLACLHRLGSIYLLLDTYLSESVKLVSMEYYFHCYINLWHIVSSTSTNYQDEFPFIKRNKMSETCWTFSLFSFYCHLVCVIETKHKEKLLWFLLSSTLRPT